MRAHDSNRRFLLSSLGNIRDDNPNIAVFRTPSFGFWVSPRSRARQQKFEPKQLQEDFRIMRSALEEGHSGIYRYTKKDELDKIFDAAQRKLDRRWTHSSFTGWRSRRGQYQMRTYAGSASTGRAEFVNTGAPILRFSVEVLDGKVFISRLLHR